MECGAVTYGCTAINQLYRRESNTPGTMVGKGEGIKATTSHSNHWSRYVVICEESGLDNSLSSSKLNYKPFWKNSTHSLSPTMMFHYVEMVQPKQ